MSDTTPPAADPDGQDEAEKRAELARLYETHQPSLLKQLRKEMSLPAARDAVQSLFCAVAERWHAGQIKNPLHYLRRASSYKLADHHREQQRQRDFEAELKQHDVWLDPTAPSAEACASRAYDPDAALEHLREKNPDAHRALQLIHLEELGVQGAADRMGKSRHQLKRLVDQARETGPSNAKARRPRKAKILLAAILAIGSALLPMRESRDFTHAPTSMVTQTSEPQELVLGDGSSMSYTLDTQFTIAFDSKTRNIHLTSGQAEFEVMPNRDRPFNVITPGIEAQAVGTRFVVRRQGHETTVSVTEGVVWVRARRGDGTESAAYTVTLAAGESITVPDDPSLLPPAESPLAHVWVQFEGERFGDAVAASNRVESILAAIDGFDGITVVRRGPNEVLITYKTESTPAAVAK